jgi:glycosyl transferase family 25
MDIYVISLGSSARRREHVASQFDRLGLHFSFFDAAVGDEGRRWFDAVDEHRFRLGTGREPAPGEIGCFASHRRLWQTCVDRDQPILIMEDDAQLEAGFPAALGAAHALIDRYGFLRLANEGPRSCAKTAIHSYAEFVVHYCSRYPYGSICYAVAPRVAAAFLAASRVLASPVDLFIKRFWAHGQPLFALCPYSVSGSVLRHLSTIEYRSRSGRRWDLQLLRTTRKAADAVQRALFNRHMVAAWTPAGAGANVRTPAAEARRARAHLGPPHQSA